MDDEGFPALSFATTGCVLCGRCVEACPEAGLFDRTREPPIPAVAEADDRCLNAQGVLCQSCLDACEHDAIRLPSLPNSAALVVAENCVGCGMCIPICPASALRVVHTS